MATDPMTATAARRPVRVPHIDHTCPTCRRRWTHTTGSCGQSAKTLRRGYSSLMCPACYEKETKSRTPASGWKWSYL